MILMDFLSISLYINDLCLRRRMETPKNKRLCKFLDEVDGILTPDFKLTSRKFESIEMI